MLVPHLVLQVLLVLVVHRVLLLIWVSSHLETTNRKLSSVLRLLNVASASFTHHQFLLHSWRWWLVARVCVSVLGRSCWLLFLLLLLGDPVLRLLVLRLVKLVFSLVVGVVLGVQLSIYDALQREGSQVTNGDHRERVCLSVCETERQSPVDVVGLYGPPSSPPPPHSTGVGLCLITRR